MRKLNGGGDEVHSKQIAILRDYSQRLFITTARGEKPQCAVASSTVDNKEPN